MEQSLKGLRTTLRTDINQKPALVRPLRQELMPFAKFNQTIITDDLAVRDLCLDWRLFSITGNGN